MKNLILVSILMTAAQATADSSIKIDSCNGSVGFQNNNDKKVLCNGATGAVKIEGNDQNYKVEMVTGDAELVQGFLDNKTRDNLIAQFMNQQSGNVYPVMTNEGGDWRIIGTAFKYADVFVTPLHAVAGFKMNNVYVYDKSDGAFRSILSAAFDQNTAIDYAQDSVLLRVDGQNPIPAISIGVPIPSHQGKGTYVQLGYPRELGNYLIPNGSAGYYIQTQSARDNLLVVERVGESIGSSGGLIYDEQSGLAVGMPICIARDNAVRAVRLIDLQARWDKLLSNESNFKPAFPEKIQFLYISRDKCGPVGGRGIFGDDGT